MEFSVLRAAEMEAPANQLRVEARAEVERLERIARRLHRETVRARSSVFVREGILPRAAAAEVSE